MEHGQGLVWTGCGGWGGRSLESFYLSAFRILELTGRAQLWDFCVWNIWERGEDLSGWS